MRISSYILHIYIYSQSDYLGTKCMAFARFYFLSNEELLEILSQTKDPRAVQPHIRKCFEAIDKVTFEEDPSSETGLQMTLMHSGEGETVKWNSKVCPKGSVEHWLTDVETMMRYKFSKVSFIVILYRNDTGTLIFENFSQAKCQHYRWLDVADYAETNRPDWVLNWPGQGRHFQKLSLI